LKAVIETGSEPFPVAGWEVRTQPLCHPGPTQAYRLTRPLYDFAYVTDNELAGGAHGVGPAWRDDLVHFLHGVHTLVHDATWSDDEVDGYPGWGHSCPRQAIRLARDVGSRRLVLFHHHPEHDDGAMDRLLESARLTAGETAPGLEVVAATEGESLVL
jgi:phosphoribosyl 1,2-cyclic phosphodiesterase